MSRKNKIRDIAAAYRKIKTCTSKKSFDTEKEAFQKNQLTYKCMYCDKYHRSGSLIEAIRSKNKNV